MIDRVTPFVGIGMGNLLNGYLVVGWLEDLVEDDIKFAIIYAFWLAIAFPRDKVIFEKYTKALSGFSCPVCIRLSHNSSVSFVFIQKSLSWSSLDYQAKGVIAS